MTGPKFAAKSVKKEKPARKRSRLSEKAVEANREASRKRAKRIYNEMSVAERSIERFRKRAKPPVPQKGSKRSEVKRLEVIATAYCDWSDLEEVVRLYIAAAVMTELTGIDYGVDHTVPLNHPLVCGLHTHTNLEVITRRLNSLKANWIWPDMWPHDASTLQLLEDMVQEEQEDRLEAAKNEQHPRSSAALRKRA